MKKFIVTSLLLLVAVFLLVTFGGNSKENIWNQHIPLETGEKVMLEDVSTFTLKDARFSSDGTRFAFAYHAIETEDKERVQQIFPIAEAESNSYLSTNYLILDGEIIHEAEGTANSRMYDFGFLSDSTFWYQISEYKDGKSIFQLRLEEVQVPEHEVSFRYKHNGETYFILDSYPESRYSNNSLERHYYHGKKEISESDLVAIDLGFLTRIKFNHGEFSVCMGDASTCKLLDPRDVAVSSVGDILYPFGGNNRQNQKWYLNEQLLNEYEWYHSPRFVGSDLYFSAWESGTLYLIKNDEVLTTYQKDRPSNPNGSPIDNFTLTERGLIYSVNEYPNGAYIEANGDQRTIYNSIKTIVSNGDNYAALATPRNEKAYGDNNGIVLIVNGKEHKLYHYVFPESLVITDSNILKFAAILNNDLVFVELQL